MISKCCNDAYDTVLQKFRELGEILPKVETKGFND